MCIFSFQRAENQNLKSRRLRQTKTETFLIGSLISNLAVTGEVAHTIGLDPHPVNDVFKKNENSSFPAFLWAFLPKIEQCLNRGKYSHKTFFGVCSACRQENGPDLVINISESGSITNKPSQRRHACCRKRYRSPFKTGKSPCTRLPGKPAYPQLKHVQGRRNSTSCDGSCNGFESSRDALNKQSAHRIACITL